MAASSTQPLNEASKRLFLTYYKKIQEANKTAMEESRARLVLLDKLYQREMDHTEDQRKSEAANRAGDTSKLQNITVPIVMPQVETAVVYQTSVFLTGYPLFGAVAAPQFIDEALQLESVIEDQSLRGGWARELMLFFRDGAKFNKGFVELSWKEEVTAAVTNNPAGANGAEVKNVIWSGNAMRRLDPYNTFVDARVPPAEAYRKGEYAGFTEYMSKIQLKSFIAELPDKIVSSITPAFESSSPNDYSVGTSSYYIPDVNRTVTTKDIKSGDIDWMSWASLASEGGKKGIQYKGGYEVTTLYCKVLPSEMQLKVANSNTPQIYKLIIINHSHIIYAEKQTNAHGWLPIFVGQPNEDGLGKQTKSLAENVAPFQDVASAYMNSIMSSRRRAISDRTLYDPSRVSSAHINNPNPSAKIPVRPAAYGKNVADAVHQFPYREDQASNSLQQIQTLMGLANTLTGQNQASQGQFVKGNKTLQEFESVMQNANGRDQAVSILYEHQVFVPLKHVLKLNILQFQGGTTIYNRDKQVAVEIDPIKLRKAVLEFKISDGLVPASKMLNSETFGTAIQVLGSSPQIGAGYNVAQLFSYFMKTQGAKISEFEKSPEQQAYEQALSSWQAMTQLAIEKGVEFTQAQPQPQAYNYDPRANKPAPTDTSGRETTPNEPGAQ